MLAVAGNLHRIASVLAIRAAVLFSVLCRTPASGMRATSFWFVGHSSLLFEHRAISWPLKLPPRGPIRSLVTEMFRNTESIFETAASAEAEPGDLAILVGRNGSLRLVMGGDWPLESLISEHGSSAAYKVTRTASQVRVEGRSGASLCVLESEPQASVAKRLLADRPRYVLSQAA